MDEKKVYALLCDMHQAVKKPLNHIIGDSEMILKEYVNLKVREYVMDIRSATYHVLSMANDLMDFSKLNAGVLTLENGDYDLQELIYELISYVRPKAAAKKLDFNLSLDQGLPRRLYGDRTRIKQIVIRLLDNAVRFTKKGRITLYIACPYSDRSRALIEFKVIDTGIGIGQADLEKIFSGDDRSKLSQDFNIGGLGIGLYLAKSLAQLMDGDVLVSSQKGTGSTFSAGIVQEVRSKEYLDEKLYCLDLSQIRMPFRADGAKILIIEDNLINAKAVYYILKRYGIIADIAESMQKVAAFVREVRYDLVLVDQGMPELEGSDMVYIIREMDEFMQDETVGFRHLPMIAMAGGMSDLPGENFDEEIHKPVEIMEIERVLRHWLPEALIQYDTDFDVRAGRAPILDALGINYSTAIMNFNGDEDEYYEVLRSFYKAAPARIYTLQRFLEERDFKNFLFSLRSLISIARIIGTEILFYQSKVLEELCIREEYGLLIDKAGSVLEYYRKIAAELKPLIRSKKGNELKNEISREELVIMIKELIEHIRDYRIEQAEQIFFSMAQKKYEDDHVIDALHQVEETFMSTYLNKDIIQSLTEVLNLLRRK